MKLIVGLGNPGKEYAGSRHNAGFFAIDALAKSHGIKLKRPFGCRWVSAKFRIGHQDILLAEPLTYMNLSGPAVAALVKKYRVGLSDLLIICDDIDLELGRLKIRAEGSYGGHRGLESIISSLGSKDFSRLRIGIGRPHGKEDTAEYVLAAFSAKEKKIIAEAIGNACECAGIWIVGGVDKAMNMFNKNTRP